MEELNKEVVDQTPENTVEETTEQPIEEVVETKTKEQLRDEKGRFKSKSDDSVIKIDLSKPPPSNEVVEQKENVKEEPKVTEGIKEDIPVIVGATYNTSFLAGLSEVI